MKRRKKQDIDENYYFERQSSTGERGDAVTFFGGLMLFAIGAYMIFNNTRVSTSFGLSRIIGFEPPFGVVLIPLILGIIVLFMKSNSIFGWFLVVFGVLIILAGILMNIRIAFNSTTLFETIVMYGMTAAGIGLTLRGLYKKK